MQVVQVVASGSLPAELASLRDQAGLSRRRLGTLANVSEGTIKLIESGDSEQPHPSTLRALATGLATHRLAGRADPEHVEALYARLMRAAGYLPGDFTDEPEGELPADIMANARELMGTDEGMFRALLAGLARLPDNTSRRRALRFLGEALEFGTPNGPRRR
jgi:transcriptional regulator with XRE-family HTH domain